MHAHTRTRTNSRAFLPAAHIHKHAHKYAHPHTGCLWKHFESIVVFVFLQLGTEEFHLYPPKKEHKHTDTLSSLVWRYTSSLVWRYTPCRYLHTKDEILLHARARQHTVMEQYAGFALDLTHFRVIGSYYADSAVWLGHSVIGSYYTHTTTTSI